ncbi:glycosyltransferase [Blastochloris sulfoviridis]|uniref:Glycosyltransferase family 2 protein n=1 Tax=Blastochloris sulfoviridis TaxID=50712 RepID=A0A5M6HJN8_9HYPH|nr:glycosyltransferase family 2 protein [Blastochloris sulfoviridis]KAA5595965.1 glycosyltransferase family 2 protein [Blastochloris sulfoviridis]
MTETQSGKTRVLRRTVGKALAPPAAGPKPAEAVRQGGTRHVGQDVGQGAGQGAGHDAGENAGPIAGQDTGRTLPQPGGVRKAEDPPRRDAAPGPLAPTAPAVQVSFLSLSQLPHLVRSPGGDVLDGLMVDYYAYVGDRLLLSGWVVGAGSSRRIDSEDDAVRACLFARPDVESAFPALAASARGLLAVVKPGAGDTFTLFGRRLRAPRRADGEGDPARMFQDHRARLGFLLEALQGGAVSLAPLVAQLQAAPAAYKRARGFLEHAKGVPGHGGLVVGWTVQVPGVTLALVDQRGRIVPLAEAVRWHRPDIVDAFSNEFGNFTFNAGMLQGWRHAVTLGEEVRLCVFERDECHILASRQWEAAPVEPVSFAKWAFEFPTPLDRFFERLEHHDGAVIDSLVAAKLAARPPCPPEIMVCGPQPESPRCSIVVPLFGRFDFMLNQLLEFSEDDELKADAELIYVVDDPRILSDVRQQAPLLYEANRVPFRIVTAGENRGFSGANNLGISVARAPHLLLLNSDVIPVEPGWLQKMLAVIEGRADVGIVGARLFYPNGAIQHDGMAFVWEPAWNVHLNKHPRAGLEPLEGETQAASAQDIVTAACLLIRWSTYEAIGGLDEGYLIGDFEDSDLCMKVRQQGLKTILVKDINLIHLERQSFPGIGADRFREQIARYNAWRHQRRWAAQIEDIVSSAAARAIKP